ncbi:pituitary tumor-transforming gene 1 protein-interacting protein isoform X2 [Hydra vulgaris]|uniref:Pituitary tumor-transforming gene 1 protein-interacting protein isoform X2 n=1 Tax=Hydra vulgaris TaxID=6087 RepID=A0ABM4D9X2_HYDVU
MSWLKHLLILTFVFAIKICLVYSNGTVFTTPSVVTTTPHFNCSIYTSCRTCTNVNSCFWCEPSKVCEKFPSKQIFPSGCAKNEWYWKQCLVPGYILMIVVPSLAFIVLLSCGCFIYCKCCRKSNTSWKKEEDKLTQKKKEQQVKAEERKAERKERSDALRMKYGLLKSDDEDPLLN